MYIEGFIHPSESGVKTMNHTLQISVTKTAPHDPILACRTVRIGARLWARLFGRQKVVVLVPGDSVDTVRIIEKEGAKDIDGS